MLRHTLLLTALVAALAATAPAQRGEPLSILTTHRGLAERVLDHFDFDGELPPLEPGANWVLSVDASGSFAAGTSRTMVGSLQVIARPRELAELFADGFASGRELAQGTFAMALRRLGLRTAEAVDVFRALFDFPKQVAVARLRVDGDLDNPTARLSAQLWLTPAPGTWLASFVAAVKPSNLPSPLPHDPRPTAILRVAAALDEPDAALAPLGWALAAAGASSDDEARRTAEHMGTFWRLLLGGMAMSWNVRDHSATFVTELKDAAALAKLKQHPTLLAWMQAERTTQSGFDVAFTPAGLSHHGFELWKSVTTAAPQVAERVPGGLLRAPLVSYGGIVGSYLVGTTGLDEDGVRSLVDAARNHQLKRDVLGKLYFARLTVRLAEFVDAMTGGAVQGLPQIVKLQVGNTGSQLVLTLEIP